MTRPARPRKPRWPSRSPRPTRALPIAPCGGPGGVRSSGPAPPTGGHRYRRVLPRRLSGRARGRAGRLPEGLPRHRPLPRRRDVSHVDPADHDQHRAEPANPPPRQEAHRAARRNPHRDTRTRPGQRPRQRRHPRQLGQSRAPPRAQGAAPRARAGDLRARAGGARGRRPARYRRRVVRGDRDEHRRADRHGEVEGPPSTAGAARPDGAVPLTSRFAVCDCRRRAAKRDKGKSVASLCGSLLSPGAGWAGRFTPKRGLLARPSCPRATRCRPGYRASI